MKEIEAIAATTHRDAHGEILAPEAIDQMADQINSQCLPIWFQHDPRVPPRGRYTSAEARTLPDGERAVIARGELWEPGDEVPFLADRKMPLGAPESDEPFIGFDRGMSDSESLRDIREIASIFGSAPRPDVKKAVDPIMVLTIGGLFAANAVAGGFLKRFGADMYDVVKGKVKSIFARKLRQPRPDTPPDVLLRFQVFVVDRGETCLVDVIITNPTPEDIDYLFGDGLTALDTLIPALLRNRGSVQRIVIDVQKSELVVKFGVRSDCVPLVAEHREFPGS